MRFKDVTNALKTQKQLGVCKQLLLSPDFKTCLDFKIILTKMM